MAEEQGQPLYRINRTLDRLFKSLDTLTAAVNNQTTTINDMQVDAHQRDKSIAEAINRLNTEVANLKYASTQYYVSPPSVDLSHLQTWHQVVDRTDEPAT